MLNRFKRALVDSYVGAIALGYLLADAVLHFCYIFSSPLAGWVSRTEYRNLLTRANAPQGFMLRDALPELVRFVLLLVAWVVLMRWLYFTSAKNTSSATKVSQEQVS